MLDCLSFRLSRRLILFNDVTLSEGKNTTKKNDYDITLKIQRLPPSVGGLCKESLTVTSDENPDKKLFKEIRIGNDAELPKNKCKVKFIVEDQARGKSATVTVTLTYGSEKPTSSFRVTITKKASSAAYFIGLAVSDYAGKAMKVRHGSNQALAEVAFDSTGVVSPLSPVTITEVGFSSWHLDQTMAFSAFYSDSSSVFAQTSERGISASEVRSSREPAFSVLLTQQHDQDSGRPNLTSQFQGLDLELPSKESLFFFPFCVHSPQNLGDL